ncbi:hypothetical protein CPB97_004922 [Podila verticillata]|nr:hypothetical protein CPB97_004922 [Podila verticillata]
MRLCIIIKAHKTQLIFSYHLDQMASNKILLLLVTLATSLAMTQAAGAPTIPAWCSCSGNKSLTQTACGRAGGNWDGGSCGLDSVPKFNSFGNNCYSLGGQGKCWN